MQPMYASNQGTNLLQLKESIRDMIRLQRDYQLSDELFWEIFNARVLLNEHIDVDDFVTDFNPTTAQA
jgi:hypothetical protein